MTARPGRARSCEGGLFAWCGVKATCSLRIVFGARAPRPAPLSTCASQPLRDGSDCGRPRQTSSSAEEAAAQRHGGSGLLGWPHLQVHWAHARAAGGADGLARHARLRPRAWGAPAARPLGGRARAAETRRCDEASQRGRLCRACTRARRPVALPAASFGGSKSSHPPPLRTSGYYHGRRRIRRVAGLPQGPHRRSPEVHLARRNQGALCP